MPTVDRDREFSLKIAKQHEVYGKNKKNLQSILQIPPLHILHADSSSNNVHKHDLADVSSILHRFLLYMCSVIFKDSQKDYLGGLQDQVKKRR